MKKTWHGDIRRVSKIVTAILSLAFLTQFLLFTTPCYSQSIDAIAADIRTPEELALWLSRNITYEFVFGGKSANTIQEILDAEKGNCEDFANLASEILKRMGIKNKVIILKLKGSPADHAACIWKNNDGTYSFISNEELYKTKETIVADAIAKFFPECYKISDYSDARIAWR